MPGWRSLRSLRDRSSGLPSRVSMLQFRRAISGWGSAHHGSGMRRRFDLRQKPMRVHPLIRPQPLRVGRRAGNRSPCLRWNAPRGRDPVLARSDGQSKARGQNLPASGQAAGIPERLSPASPGYSGTSIVHLNPNAFIPRPASDEYSAGLRVLDCVRNQVKKHRAKHSFVADYDRVARTD